ncbi:hypothetical protein IU427_06525 [Nocardia beijingensis]|uniref:hypothetical protein n=1 Tax=Nocardia beijingensis TaxID=95162 RepID=UPI001894B3E7|nr:hypothetical protein [Nocardia beijingensis]MBF6464838.1 hypothetical protein [Nocardia beijingensis]
MTNAADSALFQPVALGTLVLPHRLVMAPMTRNRAAADGRCSGGFGRCGRAS